MRALKDVLQRAAALFSGAAAELPDEEAPPVFSPSRPSPTGPLSHFAVEGETSDAPLSQRSGRGAGGEGLDVVSMKAEIARLRHVTVRQEAERFADQLFHDNRIVPSERAHVVAAFTQAALDDAASASVTFALAGGQAASRVDALKAYHLARPRHQALDEVIASGEKGERLVLLSSGVDGEAVQDAEVDENLCKTALGKKTLKARNPERNGK